MSRRILFILFVLVALTLAACGGGGNGARKETIDVVMHDIYFGASNDNVANPPVWTVTSGAEVTVEMDNQGAMEHSWAIVKLGEELPEPFDAAQHGDKLLFSSGRVLGGTKATATFTTPEPGEYVVICTVPGHYPSMQGRLVVN
jgi:plastocyanin